MEKSNFFSDVYEVVKLIPAGRVSTYGAIAAYLGAKKSARMVGWALNQAIADLSEIPAHRVVNRQGLLTGRHHFSTPTRMEEMLQAEGVAVSRNAVAQFQERFWNPITELA